MDIEKSEPQSPAASAAKQSIAFARLLRPARNAGTRRRWLARIFIGAAVLALCGLMASRLKLFEPLPLDEAAVSSRLVLDRDGRLLRAFTAPSGRWRLDTTPGEVSTTYLSLLFAFEDHRFWKHPGVDPAALGRAVLQAVRHGRLVSGGSTLTMQVARLMRGSPTHSFWAKFQQIADAFRLEAVLNKREILTLYLKLAPYGGNIEGVRAASLAYFGKEPYRLSIAEAALLVAIPQSPEIRRPDRGYESLLEARNRVIRRAVAAHAVSQADASFAIAQAMPRGRRDFPALAPQLSERLLAVAPPGPAAIRTTIDKNLQEAAEAITRRNAEAIGGKISIAALVVKNTTGEVLAHVGSAGYLDGMRLGAIDMTAAIRSPGSALKPFIYGLAFEDGLAHPETLIEDSPVRFDTYAPANFDNVFHGTVTVRTALQLSLNVPAVKVLNEV
jgi:penicillin-binding protein 1C